MFRKNVAGQYLYFCLVNASTGAALTGATVTGKRSIDGAAQASVTGTITEDAGGQYHLALSQADTNGNDIGYLFTATSAIPVSIHIVTTASDPTDAAAFGLSRLDAAISSRSTYSGGAVASVTAAVTVGTNNDKTGYALTSGEHTNIASDTQTGLTAQGYTTTRAGYMDVLNGLVAAIWANATRTLSAFGFTVATNSDANVTAIKAKTDNLPASPAAVGSQMDLVNAPNATALNAAADAMLKRDWTAIAGEAAHSALNALRFLRNKWSVSAGTLTVTKEDGTTAAWAGHVSTDPTAQPVTGNSPTT